jgi:hypothetical protein
MKFQSKENKVESISDYLKNEIKIVNEIIKMVKERKSNNIL